MVISIDWSPTTPALHRINQDLVHRGRRWPTPIADSPLVTAEELNLARGQWAARLRATYLTTAQAATSLQHLLTLGAPLELLSGATYTTDELSRHLGLTAHIYRALHPSDDLKLSGELLPSSHTPPTWALLFEDLLELFAFNLTLSRPLLEATHVITSDSAISELTDVQSKSLEELVGFGQAALEWMIRKLTDQDLQRIQALLPTRLSAYEALSKGSPARLDSLAGQEITLETQAGNLGTLTPDQLAASFYHTLNFTIFPILDELGWDAMKAWRKQPPEPPHGLSQRGLIMAIGSA